MSTLKVSTKGKVTLPKNVLKHLGVGPGEKISVSKLPAARLELKSVRPTARFQMPSAC
ncbi:MAG: hypothetical protein QOH32_1949 [Bradyrhizobium sp.]|jgi:AbrB family looped-hinge helix DNA binding protein|nr:hypothetical protein [Bradyrhizobium sp.]